MQLQLEQQRKVLQGLEANLEAARRELRTSRAEAEGHAAALRSERAAQEELRAERDELQRWGCVVGGSQGGSGGAAASCASDGGQKEEGASLPVNGELSEQLRAARQERAALRLAALLPAEELRAELDAAWRPVAERLRLEVASGRKLFIELCAAASDTEALLRSAEAAEEEVRGPLRDAVLEARDRKIQHLQAQLNTRTQQIAALESAKSVLLASVTAAADKKPAAGSSAAVAPVAKVAEGSAAQQEVPVIGRRVEVVRPLLQPGAKQRQRRSAPSRTASKTAASTAEPTANGREPLVPPLQPPPQQLEETPCALPPLVPPALPLEPPVLRGDCEQADSPSQLSETPVLSFSVVDPYAGAPLEEWELRTPLEATELAPSGGDGP